MSLDVRETLRLRLSGEIDLTVPSGAARVDVLQFEWVRSPPGAFSLTLEGALGEMRKFAPLNAGLSDLLGRLEHDTDSARSRIVLVAPPELVRELENAAARLPDDASPQDLLRDAGWAAIAFAYPRLLPSAVSLVTPI